MSSTYQFSIPENTNVDRADDDGMRASIPWGASGPENMDTVAGQKWLADGSPVPAAYVAPPEPVPETISARQFWQQMAVQGLIDEEEAVEALEGDLPNDIKHYINNTLPANERFAARMFFTATTFARTERAAADIKARFSLTDAAVDSFFIAAALL